MKFSVIIPTYNRADLLDRCLQSLTEQTFKDFEVLVCDDGSTDNSAQVTQKYAEQLNVQYLWEANWGGPARPRNRGIAASKGEWICFLDSDDWWMPNKLEVCLKFLHDYDFLYHDMQIFSQTNGMQNNNLIKGRIPSHPFFENMLLKGNCCANSSVVVRKTIVDKVGLLSEDKALMAVEDFDYWLRVSQITERFCCIKQMLGYYWVGDTSISFNEKQIQKHIALYGKHIQQIGDLKLKTQIIARQAYRNARAYALFGKTSDAQIQYSVAFHTNHFYTKIKSIAFYLLNTVKG